MAKEAKLNPATGQAEEVAPGIRRITAPNPSPMTFRGTNTYLLGEREVAVIDPGPPDEAHLDAIMGALEAHQRISHIFVTHAHIDHSPLAMVLAQLVGARVHAFGPARAGQNPLMAGFGDLGGGEGVDEAFQPDTALPDGAEVEAADWRIRALHTPGHMGNHMCFDLLAADGSRRGITFTGDTVMGWATSMVSPPDGDLTDFMGSLRRLQGLGDHAHFLPGHGDAIPDPAARLAELLAHREGREAQILAALAAGPATPSALAERIYTDVAPALLPAAERNVLAHLIDLCTRELVAAEGEISPRACFALRG